MGKKTIRYDEDVELILKKLKASQSVSENAIIISAIKFYDSYLDGKNDIVSTNIANLIENYFDVNVKKINTQINSVKIETNILRQIYEVILQADGLSIPPADIEEFRKNAVSEIFNKNVRID